ncbi:MAG: DUF4336 domain-containing protein [Pseudanabaenaceae cyanobacterium]
MQLSRFWGYWFLLPLYPYSQRPTLCREIVPQRIWVFEQLQGILYAVVPLRMTVVALEEGGLLVYAPVAPTQECLALLQKLIDRYGDIRHIVLPTTSGLEHKVYVPAFRRRFPQAQLWLAPGQWSFPINLPSSWLGLRGEVIREGGTPWGREFDHALLQIDLGRGNFAEVAIYHQPSRTLLLTDLVIAFSLEPPEILTVDPFPLLFHSRDRAADIPTDTPENRRKGWHRIALFATYFRPAAVEALSVWETVKQALAAPDRSPRNYFGLYPFRWQYNWEESFYHLWGGGRPIVAPILQELILPQAPYAVQHWLDRVCQWDFTQIIPCHLKAPIAATAKDLRQAFANSNLPPSDTKFVTELEAFLVARGIAKPRPKA